MAERRVAFVTGASRGIGRACALELARRGLDVVVTARTVTGADRLEHSSTVKKSATNPLPGSLEATAREARALGAEALVVKLDLAARADWPAAVDAALARFGRIDVLVNNGRYVGPGHMDPFEDTPVELIEQMMLCNVIAPLHLVKLCLPAMKRQGGGIVINITSSAGERETPAPIGQGGWGLGYSLSKAALNRMGPGLAKELRPYSIAVIGLMPGFVGTERMAAELAECGRHPLRADEARHEADDGDAVRAELLREPGPHAVQGRLGERVAEAPAALADGRRRLPLPRARGDVDDDAAALALHGREAELHEMQRRDHVAEHHLLDQLDRRVLEGVHVPGADVAAVVDQHVDPPEAREGGVDRRRPVLARGEVELHDQGVGAERPHLAPRRLEAARQRRGERLLHRGGMFEPLRAGHGARRHHHVEAAPRQLERARPPDAAARAGHERDPSLGHAAVPSAAARAGSNPVSWSGEGYARAAGGARSAEQALERRGLRPSRGRSAQRGATI